MRKQYRVGDRVVYTLDKYSACPGRRAKNVFAAPTGESYQYQVDKYWRVTEIREGNLVVLTTRRGKTRIVDQDDTKLRRASLFERIFKGRLFPQSTRPQDCATQTA